MQYVQLFSLGQNPESRLWQKTISTSPPITQFYWLSVPEATTDLQPFTYL